MSRPVQAEEQKFFDKRAKSIKKHVKGSPALVKTIKDARKNDKSKLVSAKDYVEKNAGSNV